MKRFIYSPEVTAYIRSEEAGKVFDVSKDIVSGSVTRRLDALSDAQLTLQNKFGLYTRKFKPMDRIAIFMRRVGDPMLVFSGYVDEAPFYQMFPAPVSISASCSLKLLQNTYFDPGLPFMTQWFTKFGWIYNPSTGTITDPFYGFGNYDQTTRNKFSDGNMATLIAAALHEIGGWPRDHIFIRTIPNEFKKTLSKLMKAEALEYKEDYQHTVDRLAMLLGIGLDEDPTMVSGADLPSFTGGNASAVQLAAFAAAAGFKGDSLVIAVAVALAESSGKSDAMNYNTDGSYDVGMWQINTVHCPDAPNNGRNQPAPPHGVGTLKNPRDFNRVKNALPAVVRNFMVDMCNPQKNAQEAYGISGSGRSFSAWATYSSGAYRDHMVDAQKAVTEYRRKKGKVKLPDSQDTGTEWANTGDRSGHTPAGIKMGRAILAPGADRSGAHTKARVIAFVRRIAAVYGHGLVITTGTNHNQYVAGSHRQSQHWTGDASDIGRTTDGTSFSGTQANHNPELTKLGQAALEAAGWSKSRARAITGGLYDITFANGSKVQIIFNTLEGGDHFNHLHVGVTGTLPKEFTGGKVVVEDGGSGDANTKQGQEIQNTETIARTQAWFATQLPTTDTITAVSLTGKRALANDIPLFEWIQQMVKSSGRRFCSMPNGDFLAFFPDYFNDFNRTPYFIIRPVEIIDLQIQVSDRDLITHVFATGSQFTQQLSVFDRMVSMVASVQEPAFNMFINVDDGKKTADESKGKKKSKKKKTDALNVWKGAEKFLKHYGARPLALDLPDIRHPVLLWMAAWMEFQKHWANQFGAQASFTFMPELLPGGIINLDHKITMFVESVTHSFDMESGFTTSAELSSPASANKKDKRFGSMILAGGNFGVADAILEDKQIAEDAVPPPIRKEDRPGPN